MKLQLFKPENFDGLNLRDYEKNNVCFRALEILNDYLETLPVVYMHKATSSFLEWDYLEKNYGYSTHQARLICVEEIKPKECDHELAPWETNPSPLIAESVCVKCHKKMKAKWEVCDE